MRTSAAIALACTEAAEEKVDGEAPVSHVRDASPRLSRHELARFAVPLTWDEILGGAGQATAIATWWRTAIVQADMEHLLRWIPSRSLIGLKKQRIEIPGRWVLSDLGRKTIGL